jgi:arylformamidase
LGAPFLTAGGAQYLIDAGAALVGIDSVNIDDTESGGERPAHTPPAVEGFGTFPVRAFAEWTTGTTG